MSTIKITNENFENEVLTSKVPVLLDFWAPWCGPCKMLSPVIDEIGKELTNAKIGKVNVDEERQLASQFEVMSIPTLVIINNGEVVRVEVGVRSKEDILKMLDVYSMKG